MMPGDARFGTDRLSVIEASWELLAAGSDVEECVRQTIGGHLAVKYHPAIVSSVGECEESTHLVGYSGGVDLL
ncbi:hypothetical protein CBR_g3975 [Chara braunii]|uniref:Uncharacterized protein n=1 Tax=Chara braunii TaxID=69332 RepID=A0A388KGX1_CHABU|nr:hypothetical protein CBR_g3975 [Chara braunii]|eukprot:GBG69276.1 hypothetical protein CBR_g3975 [Chara braunii]